MNATTQLRTALPPSRRSRSGLRSKAALLALVPMCFAAGCASVPPETVELSHTIGADIAELHRSHRALAELHFSSLKDDVDHFIDRTYRPALIAEAAEEADLVRTIGIILDRDPGRLPDYLTRFLTRVDPAVEAKRREMLGPIERQEASLLATIEASYTAVESGNATISGHLASIRSVHDAQSRALEILGLPDMREDVATRTATISEQISELNSRGAEISATLGDAGEKVRELDQEIEKWTKRLGRKD